MWSRLRIGSWFSKPTIEGSIPSETATCYCSPIGRGNTSRAYTGMGSNPLSSTMFSPEDGALVS